MSGEKAPRKTGKRPGRKPVKIDVKAKLERSRQSARECRARKKLRYQYIEELVTNREKAVFALREELQTCKDWCEKLDSGIIDKELRKLILQEKTEQSNTELQSYVPFTTYDMPTSSINTLEPIYSQSEYSTYSPSPRSMKQTTSPQPMNNQYSNSNQGASNDVLERTHETPSYMPNRPSVSQLSEKEQIYSWYLFLKGDEHRYHIDKTGSGVGPPQPLEAGGSSVPSVVTDYLDVSNSSDSSAS